MGRRRRGWGGSEGEDAPTRISSTAQEPADIPRLAPKSMSASPAAAPQAGTRFWRRWRSGHSQGKEGQEPESAQCARVPDAIDCLCARAHLPREARPRSIYARKVSLRLFLPSRDSLIRACNTFGLPNCSCLPVLLFASLSRPRRGQMEPVEGERARKEGSIPAPLLLQTPTRALRHS